MFRGNCIPLLLLALLPAGCDLTAHLSATRWGGKDAGTSDAGRPQPDLEPDLEPDLAPESPSSDDAATDTCQQQKIDLSLPKADVVLLVERSAMLLQPVGPYCVTCGTLWNLVQPAIDRLTSATTNRFRWGLKLFPASAGEACAASPDLDVPPADQAHDAILAELSAAALGGQSPLTAGLHAVRNYFDSLADNLPKFILIVMAGTPTCGPGGDPASDDFSAAVSEVTQSNRFVFVMGVGPAPFRLDRLALAGNTFSSYPLEQGQNLLTNMQNLARSIAASTCNFSIPTPIPPGQSVAVSLDGKSLTEGAPDGFLLSDHGSRIQLTGAPCYYAGAAQEITIKVGCD